MSADGWSTVWNTSKGEKETMKNMSAYTYLFIHPESFDTVTVVR